jgi:hypothetical protein
VLKNISTGQSTVVAVAKLVWKGEELLEIVSELLEGELDNLWLLLFTLILNFLCSKPT